MAGEAPVFLPRRRQRPPSLQAPREHVVGGTLAFRSAADGFTLLLPVALADQLDRHARAHAPDECIGLLLGQRGEDDRGAYLAILAVLVDEGAHKTSVTVTTTPESEAAVRALAEAQHPGLEVWGWWHTHLRYGAFFSTEDERNQAAWIASDACGVVVDPWSSPSIAAFRGPRSEPLALLGDPRVRLDAGGHPRAASQELHGDPRVRPDARPRPVPIRPTPPASPGRRRARRWLWAALVALSCLLASWLVRVVARGPARGPSPRPVPTEDAFSSAPEDGAVTVAVAVEASASEPLPSGPLSSQAPSIPEALPSRIFSAPEALSSEDTSFSASSPH